MQWMISEETILNLAIWQLLLGLGFTAMLGLVTWRLRNVQAASRYHIWTAAFFTIALLPWLALMPASAPQTTVQVFQSPDQQATFVVHPGEAQQGTTLTASIAQFQAPPNQTPSKTPIEIHGTSSVTGNVVQATFQPATLASEANFHQEGSGVASQFSLQKHGWFVLLAIWAGIALFLLLKLAFGIKHLGRLKRDSEPIEGPLAQWFEQTLNQTGLGRRPLLKTHPTIGSPLVAGLLKPVILVPEPLIHQLSEDALRQILLHELAHIRRWDDWIHLCQRAVTAIFWFHPALHWLSRQMAWDRETACDQWAVTITGKSKQYAYSLLRVSETMTHPSSGLLTVGAVRGKKQLAHRIESLLNASPKPTRLNATFKTFIFILFAGCLASMAVAGPKLVWIQGQGSQTAQAEAEEKRAAEKALSQQLQELRRERAQLLEQLRETEAKLVKEHARGLQKDRAEMLAKEKRLLERSRGIQTGERNLLAERERRVHELERRQEIREKETQKLRAEMERRAQELARVSEETQNTESQQLEKMVKEHALRNEELVAREKQLLERSRGVRAEERSELVEKERRLQELARANEGTLLAEAQQLEKTAQERARRNEEMLALAKAKVDNLSARADSASAEAFASQQNALEKKAYAMAEAERQASQQHDQLAQANEELAKLHQSQAENLAISSGYQSHTNEYIVGSDSGKSRMVHKNNHYEVEIRGKVTFLPDESDVESISKGGSFKLVDNRRRQKHSLTIRPGRNGELEYTYRYNRSKRDFDASAQQWFADFLPEILMETAIAARPRVARILNEQGLPGVFTMIARVKSDYAKSIYLRILVGNKDLSMADLGRVIKETQKVGSDFHRSQILTELAESRASNPELAGILVDGMKGMGSDFEKRRVLTKVVPMTQDPAAMTKLLGVVKTMGSDFEKRQVLKLVGRQWAAGDLANLGFFEALSQINSDFEFRQVVEGLTIDHTLTQKQTTELAALSSKRVSSDFELAKVLRHLSENLYIDQEFEKAFRRMGSDHEKTKLLTHIIGRGDLDLAEQSTILDCTRSIHSDFSRSNALQAFRNHYDLEGDIANQFHEMVRSLSSSHYRNRLTDH